MKLTNSPLVLVLAQLRIAPVLAMERFVLDVQERLRKSGFPRFVRTQVQDLAFGPGGPMIQTSNRWEFADESSRWMVVVTENSVAILTTAHETFESPFLDRLLLAASTVGEFAAPVHVHRAGLRYVNLVSRAEGRGFSEYLHAGFLGPKPETVGFANVMTKFAAVGESSEGILALRCNFVGAEELLPSDLVVGNLRKLRDDVAYSEPRAFLDIDHFAEIDAGLNIDAIKDRYHRLHGVTRQAFLAAVTPFALQAWGKTDD